MDRDRLREQIEPLLEQAGMELDRLDVVPAGRRTVVRVTVDGDGPEGHGPGLDDIGEVSAEISRALDDSEAVGQAPYTLEVTTRGVSAPLTAPRHFRRNRGRLVEIELAGHDEAPFTGRILESDEASVVVEVPGPDSTKRRPTTTRRTVDLADIARAVVQVELNRPETSQEN